MLNMLLFIVFDMVMLLFFCCVINKFDIVLGILFFVVSKVRFVMIFGILSVKLIIDII